MKSFLALAALAVLATVSPTHAFFGQSFHSLGKTSQGVLNHVLDMQDTMDNRLFVPFANINKAVFPQYFDQVLDHDDGMNDNTWKQLFFIDEQYWCGDGCPIFFMIGGEGPISDRYVNGFYYSEWAKEHKALIVTLEHRFYGESQPTGDLSNESLKLLSSKQALQDIATFQRSITNKYNAQNSKWVAFGGSYPGNLSAWVRLKFPDLFFASVSSSAPVKAELNFYQYLETVTEDLVRFGGDECANIFATATAEIEAMISKKQYGMIEETFHLCQPIKDEHDIGVFVSYLTDMLMGTAQYNGRSMKDMTWLCSNVKTATTQGLTAVQAWMKLLEMGGKCLDGSYENQVKMWDESSEEAMRSWLYQTCTEFGYYQTTDSPNEHLFPRSYPLAESLKFCNDIFDTDLTVESFEASIKATNEFYGGLSVAEMDNIYFVNGLVDPWHTLGVLESKNSKSPVTVGVWSHCADMGFPSKQFPNQELDDTRKKIGEWLNKILDIKSDMKPEKESSNVVIVHFN